MASIIYTKKHAHLFVVLLLGSLITGMSVTTKANPPMTENARTGARLIIMSGLLSLFKKKLVATRGLQKLAKITNTDETDLIDTSVLGLYNWAWGYGYESACNYLANTAPGKSLSQDKQFNILRYGYNKLQGNTSDVLLAAYEGIIEAVVPAQLLGDTFQKSPNSSTNSNIDPFKSPAQSFDWRFHAIASPLIQLIATSKIYQRLVSKIPILNDMYFDRFVCPKAKKGCPGICDECEGKHIFRKLPLVLIGHHVKTEEKRKFLENWSKTHMQPAKPQPASVQQPQQPNAPQANVPQALIERLEQQFSKGAQSTCSLCKKQNTSVIQLCQNSHMACAQCLVLTTYIEGCCTHPKDAGNNCGKRLTHTQNQLQLPRIGDNSILQAALYYAPKLTACINTLRRDQKPTPQDIQASRQEIEGAAGQLSQSGIDANNLLLMLDNLTSTPVQVPKPQNAAPVPEPGPVVDKRETYEQKFHGLYSSEQEELGIKSVSLDPDYGKRVLWHTIKDVAKLFLKQDGSQLFALASLKYKLDPWTNRHTKCPDNCLTVCHRCKLKSVYRPYATTSI